MIQLSPELAFLAGTGEVGALIGALDWSATSLGPIDAWPATVRTVVSMVLRSPVPIVTLWGEDGFMLYNAAYSVVAGERHPHLLGMPVRAGWPEVADFNDHVMRTGLAGQTLAYTDQELTLYRNGAPEQVWLNLDYSPITDDCGRPVGVMALVAETTSKVLAQRQLRNEHEKLATMFEQAPGFMAMLTGPDHVFTLHNKAYADLVGHRPVLGKPVREALPEVAPQGFVTLLDQLFVSGEAYRGSAIPVSLEATEAAPERQVFVDFVYQPLRDAAGDVFGIFVQGSDVTDRVLAERAMHESQLNFQTLAQTMLNHVWTAGPDGTPDWCNDRVYEYTGMTPDQFDVAGWRDTAHPDDLAAADRRWEVSLRTGAVYEMEFRLRDRHGHYRWHLGRAAPVRGRDGAVHRWIGTSTDIHNQKVASELLAESNQTLGQQVALRTAERDRMWTLSTDIMLVADARSIIKAVNPAVLAATGWDPGEMVGQSFFDFVHPDDHDATRAAVAVHDGARPAFRVENRCLCKSGEYRRFAWTGAPDGQFIYAVGRDTTAEHAAVETARKAEMALRQAQKMDAIGKLTGGVAHDFNNLLQVISGNLQLIAADVADNPTAQVRLQNALGGVARGAKLAGYLLAFGRRQALEPKVVRISRTVSGMEDMLARALGEECHIEIAAQAGLWNTFVDPAQVENAVLNLCINARDAMAGRGRLRISVDNVELDEASVQDQAEVTPGQYVQIAVQDDGCGMSPEVLAQAFEPFFSTKPEGQGTGLGLSMVYGFAKQSGGHVKIDSEVGKGTTVRLYLPRSREVEDEVHPLDTRPVVGGSETILVAEDDAGVRVTVVEMLSQLGYRVLQAHDAAEALALIEGGAAVDLLFTDVVMPGALRSPELARRAMALQPDLAVLFTSGYAEDAIVHGGRLDPGVELLGKPYTRAALARKVRHVLRNHQQRRASLRVEPAPRASGGKSIMLVEDDEAIRETTAELLRLLGHSVIAVPSGEHAIGQLRDRTVDVLMTDLGLPGMSGEELVTQVRRSQPGVRVLFATGRDMEVTIADAAVLLKPYSVDKLMAALG